MVDDAPTTSNRRRVLAGAGATALVATAGCLGLLGGKSAAEPPPGWHSEAFTTAEATEPFSRQTVERTPYAGVGQIYDGDGTLVLVYFDYAHRESIRWWREGFPALSDLVARGAFRPTLAMFPVPVNEWSMLLPCALFEVRVRTTRADAWAFHEGLVAAAPNYSFGLVRDLASTVGVDGDAVVTAARERRRRNQALGDRALGRDTGVTDDALPAFRWGLDPIDADSTAELREFLEGRA